MRVYGRLVRSGLASRELQTSRIPREMQARFSRKDFDAGPEPWPARRQEFNRQLWLLPLRFRNVICYGQCASGKPASSVQVPLYDARDRVVVNGCRFNSRLILCKSWIACAVSGIWRVRYLRTSWCETSTTCCARSCQFRCGGTFRGLFSRPQRRRFPHVAGRSHS